MSESIWSPVLDFNLIESKKHLFSSIDGFQEKYLKVRVEMQSNGCKYCGKTKQAEFAQFIRNKIVEGRLKNIARELDPRTIIRYGNKIFRASEIT